MRVYQVVQRVLGALVLLPSGAIASTPQADAPPAGSDGLAFIRIVDGSNEVMRARLRDGAERQLTHTVDRQETWPFFSWPTGQLVFQADERGSPSRLYLWDEERGERLLDDRRPAAQERWADVSAGLPRLAYMRGRHLFVAELEPGKPPPKALVHGGLHVLFRPIWDPAGERIVYQRRRNVRGVSKLWIAEVGGESRQLTHDDAWFDSKPRFSRDGQQVIYTRHPTGGAPHQLAVVPAAGGEARPLLGENTADEHSASVSPTRDEIAFISDRSGRPQLYRSDLAAGTTHQLTDVPGSVWAPHWSPDGEYIVATVREITEAPRLRDRAKLGDVRVVVFDRQGKVLFETFGFMPGWMPAWP